MKRIVIFASGSGSNAENLIRFFQDHSYARVVQVLTNNPRAKVIERCNSLNVSCLCFNRTAFYGTDHVLDILKITNPDLIVLAGFLWKVPEKMIEMFEGKIVNIHPALLPKYGGKGMYGQHVHRAVIANNEKASGITIHYVNENYDEGQIIFQKQFGITEADDVESVTAKVRELELENYPEVVLEILREKNER